MDWVKMADEKPAQGQRCIVSYGNGDIDIDRFASTAFLFYGLCGEVTHWMPLPESPHKE